MNTCTTIPRFLFLLFAGVAAMALPVYQICRRGVGTARIDAHRVKPSAWRHAFRRALAGWRQMFVRLWPALAVMALMLVVASQTDASDAAGGVLLAATPLNCALERKAELKAEGLKILETPATSRTPQQIARLNAIEAEVAVVDQEIARLRQQAEGDTAAAARESGLGDAVAIGRPTGRRYVEMFGADALTMDSWRSREEFLAVLHSGRYDERLRAPRLLGIAGATGGSDGGFAVPTQFVADWLDASLESEIVRPRAAIWPMTSDKRQVPGWDASDSSSSTLYGGFTGQWVGPGDTITAQEAKMRLVELNAKKLALLSQVANELLADGLGYDGQLSRAITRAMGWFMDDAFLTGTGGGQPLGVHNAACTITVTKEVGQAAATIVYPNLTKMFARLHPSCVANAVWVASSTTIPQLAELSIPIGTGGAHVPVMTESSGQFKILTRPVIFTEKVPALGSLGDIGLYDFSQYAVGLRREMSLDRSQHAGFSRDTTFYRGLLRADGMPTWDRAYTPKNGDTLSPFVILEARS